MTIDRIRSTVRIKPGRLGGQHGFTMIELIVIMVIVGILAAYALPKMAAAVNMQDEAWRDEVVSALRYAQKSAVARRRLVCVTVNATTIEITVAAVNPASSCTTTAVTGPDGSAAFATAGNGDAGTSVSPAGVIYMQPDGRVTTTGAGATAADRTISMLDAADVVIYGETGHVQ